jgi:murein L,D-transpeptidase YafK
VHLRRAATFATLAAIGVCAIAGLVWPVASGYLGRRAATGDIAISDAADHRPQLSAALADAGFALGAPAHVRIYKRESLLEVWLGKPAGRFALFRSYPICKWSGTLGPKLAEGDRQAPEGFYRITLRQLNPASRPHRAFNLGFPNAFDRALGRTGSALMVHGGCSSVGCYAMTDPQIDEIYTIIDAALAAGQAEVDVAIFPFRLTETALQAEAHSPWLAFWQNLKQGADLFELTGTPPAVGTCDGAYRFGPEATSSGCTPIAGWA